MVRKCQETPVSSTFLESGEQWPRIVGCLFLFVWTLLLVSNCKIKSNNCEANTCACRQGIFFLFLFFFFLFCICYVALTQMLKKKLKEITPLYLCWFTVQNNTLQLTLADLKIASINIWGRGGTPLFGLCGYVQLNLRYGFQGLESKISLLSNAAGCLFGLEAFFVNIYFHDFSVKNYFQPFIVWVKL